MFAGSAHPSHMKAIGACAGLVVAAIAVAAIAGEGATVLAVVGGLACVAMMAMMGWMMLAPLVRRGHTRPAEREAASAPDSPKRMVS